LTCPSTLRSALRLLAACLLLAVLCAAASARGAGSDVVRVGSDLQADRLALDGRFELLEDPTRSLGPAELLKPRTDWRAAPSRPLNLGHSTSAWWLRVRLLNADTTPLRRLLQVDNPRVDYLDLQVVRDGRLAEAFRTGDRLPFAARPVPHHAFVFPVDLAPGETVELLLRRQADGGGQAELVVSDTGQGISSAMVDRIFEPFFTTKSQGMGLGLGLAISHSLVTELGGELTVESEPGRGSTFRIRLPAALPAQPAPVPVGDRGLGEPRERHRVGVLERREDVHEVMRSSRALLG